MTEQSLEDNGRSKADSILSGLERIIKELPTNNATRNYLELLMIPWKLKARRWVNKSKPRQIEINQVHRNEQINIVAVCAGHQILMCDNQMSEKTEYYLLLPMKGIVTPLGKDKNRVYERNERGAEFQKIITDEWGEELLHFPCRYVAQVQRRPLLAKSIQEFWEELENEGFFEFWDPKGGPVQWCKDHLYSHLPIMRVFEINRDLRGLVEYSDTFGKPPFLRETGIEALAIPVLTDEEFNQQFVRLWQIVQKPKYRLISDRQTM